MRAKTLSPMMPIILIHRKTRDISDILTLEISNMARSKEIHRTYYTLATLIRKCKGGKGRI